MNKTIITILVLIIIAGGGYFGYQWWQDNNQSATTNGTDDWRAYKNVEYGFEITLTDAWEGYKIKTSEMIGLGEKNIYFRVSTQSTTHGYRDGYAEPFTISVYSPSDWATLQGSEGPKPIYISQNSQYVFAYSQWQDPPEDLRNVDFGVNQIIPTFKFTD